MKSFAAAILLLGVIFAPSTHAEDENYISPLEVSGATTVDAVQAKKLFEDGAAFIDVRKESDWDAGRIPGAYHLIFDDKTPENITLTKDSLEKNEIHSKDPVVFYCNGIHCARSSLAAQEALKWGYEKVYYFRLGFPEWRAKQFPFE